jgi:phosphatidylserine/phosphatidylglycerophosphate/cardiolipin synthase-like enzyme
MLTLLALLALACPSPRARAADVSPPPLSGKVDLLITPDPDGHRAFLNAIEQAPAGQTVRMAMFHLTDAKIVDALIAAKERGVVVRVMLDRSSLKNGRFRKSFQRLENRGVEVKPSPLAYSITHQKSMTIGQSTAFITAINLTKNADVTRDFGLVVHDPAVIAEVIKVFDSDWMNTENPARVTPALTESHLLWSPVNSQERLVSLIDSARSSVLVTVENLGDRKIQGALARTAKRGIPVRLIVPMCDKNKNPLFNYPHVAELSKAGVSSRVMPYPEDPKHPYMHSKMIVVDGTRGYVGSVNFSFNSTSAARELGILFSEREPLARIAAEFEKDWAASLVVPAKPPANCPALD